tara:strand:- start:24 stop:902 length:879 start_codon:yes stop_codon:yes gene_type:complete
MAHPYRNISPLNCWKGYERVPGTKPGAKGSCRKSSPANSNHKYKLKFEKANRERYEKMPQRVKDSLQLEAWKYGGPFWSPKHQVNVDPEDGVLYNRPIYQDGTMLTYPSLSKPTSRQTEINSPANATKGGGTTKVCLPKSKVNSMSPEQKKKVVAAKESAGRSGKRERSQGSEVKGARKKGATLRDWFEKENWVNVKTGDECGAPTKRKKSNEPRKTTKGKGRNFRTVEEGAGMTEKGVKEYKKKNPGSNLQTAVTEKNPKGKRAARRKSFCARSRGWTGERGKAARRRWNC